MKISFTPALNNKQIQSFSAKQAKASTNPNQINDISNNTMQAVLGKAQVSFRGLNIDRDGVVSHNCTEGIGLGLKREQILYDKKTGNYVHTVTDRSGHLISKEEYYPKDGAEILTSINEYGEKTIKTTNPNSTTTEVYDFEDNELYIEYEDISGNHEIYDTDYDRGRKIIRRSQNGLEQPVIVIDLKTKEEVTSGPLVIDRDYDKESDTYVTHNIVTNDILKTEKYIRKGVLSELKEFNTQTGLPTKIVVLNPKNGSYKTNYYSGFGKNNLLETTIESKDKRTIQVISYAKDGKTVEKNIATHYSRDGQIDREIKFVGGSNIIETETNYKFDGSRTEATYRQNPNTIESKLFIGADNNLKGEIEYWEDGQTPKVKRNFQDNGLTVISNFTEAGKKYRTEVYNDKDELEKIKEYSKKTGTLRKETIFDVKTGNYCEIEYDRYGDLPETETVKNKDGEILSYTKYRDGEDIPEVTREYNKDRSYRDTFYDEDGNELGHQDYDKYGRKQDYRNQYRNQQSYRTENAGRTSNNQTRETETDFLRRIADEIGRKDSTIGENDWIKLAQFLGVNNTAILKNMDKPTYKQLAKKFHPDLTTDAKLKERNEIVMTILNGLYKN